MTTLDRSPSVVMSDWLRAIRPNEWTPLELAQALIQQLHAAGYVVVPEDKTDDGDHRSEAD